MNAHRRIVFLTYSGASLLDFAGPAAVFAAANRLRGPEADGAARTRPLYQVVIASAAGGRVIHSCATAVDSCRGADLGFGSRDTVLIIGAEAQPLARAVKDSAIRSLLQGAARSAERYGSVCSGAFVLAAAGLLDGHTAATHWSGREALSRAYPRVQVDPNSLYRHAGRLWTSAGVTSGIDMALAMLEADHGRALKSRVARQLVVYAHRPGHQSQFSDLLVAQVGADERFAGLLDWLSQRLDAGIRVGDMAHYMHLSERTFHRQFVATFGQTPAKLYERMRLGSAKQLIETGVATKVAAHRVGFRSEAAFRSAFRGQFGVTPGLHQRLHR